MTYISTGYIKVNQNLSFFNKLNELYQSGKECYDSFSVLYANNLFTLNASVADKKKVESVISTLIELIRDNLRREYTVVLKAISISDDTVDAFILGKNKTIHINLDTVIDNTLDDITYEGEEENYDDN